MSPSPLALQHSSGPWRTPGGGHDHTLQGTRDMLRKSSGHRKGNQPESAGRGDWTVRGRGGGCVPPGLPLTSRLLLSAFTLCQSAACGSCVIQLTLPSTPHPASNLPYAFWRLSLTPSFQMHGSPSLWGSVPQACHTHCRLGIEVSNKQVMASAWPGAARPPGFPPHFDKAARWQIHGCSAHS